MVIPRGKSALIAPRCRGDLLKARLVQLSKLSEGVERSDARTIHGARVASRRLRELLPVLELDAQVEARIGRRLRRVTRRLGAIRQIDVLFEQLENLRIEKDAGARGRRVFDEIRRDRDKAHRRAATGSLDAELGRLDRRLRKIADGLGHVDERRTSRRWVRIIDARIAKRATRLRRAVKRAGAMYRPKRLHKIRIAVKKLRYGLELSLEATRSGTQADVLALKRNQDLLGRLHDLHTLIDYMRRFHLSVEPRDVSARHAPDSLVGSLEDDCRRLHARYVRGRSALVAICDRLVVSTAPGNRGSARQAG